MVKPAPISTESQVPAGPPAAATGSPPADAAPATDPPPPKPAVTASPARDSEPARSRAAETDPVQPIVEPAANRVAVPPVERKPAVAKVQDPNAVSPKAPSPQAPSPKAPSPKAATPDTPASKAVRAARTGRKARLATARPRTEKTAARQVVPAPPASKPATVARPAPISKPARKPAAAGSVSAARTAVGTSVKAAEAGQGKTAPSLIETSLPRPPEFAAITSSAVMTQALAMAKAFGALQARMLDHACAELQATLREAETLARTDSAADAVVLQARAVRRSYDAYAEHLKQLARIAGKALGKDQDKG